MERATNPLDPQSVAGDNYGQILTSSALVGGSSVVNIAFGIVRNKAMAVLLGPAGFGLLGVFASIASLSQCVAGLGINSSGVRQIAYAASFNDADRIARTTAALRRTSVLLGVVGAVLVALFSRQISTLTFGSAREAGAISLLSIAVLLQLVSNGQAALIQGLQQIRAFAKIGVFSALFGTIVAVTLVYFFREEGAAPSLVGIAAMSLAVSWWYSSKVPIKSRRVDNLQVMQEASALLKLGLAFMASGLITIGMGYAVRTIVLRDIGFEATGLYQSAWTLGGVYVGFILQAMGADFYPRLTAISEDNAACNRLVNEQMQVGLLLAGPGVIATLALAPFAISLIYSSKFGGAVEVLRWICVGTILQVITWPMSYMIVAKGKQAAYFITEFAWGAASLILALICVRMLGLIGAGVAFFGSYVFYGLMLLPVVRRLSGFRVSKPNKKAGLIYLFLIAVVFYGFHLLPFMLASCFGTLMALLSSVYSTHVLTRLVPWENIPSPIRRVLAGLRLHP